MTRQKVGSLIAGVAAIGFLGTAALHSAGYSSVVRIAAQAPEKAHALLPMLWLGIASDSTVVGLIVAVVPLRPGGPARPILAIAAICPLAAAGLQIKFLGFIAPTGILIGVTAVTLIAAIALPPTRAPAGAEL